MANRRGVDQVVLFEVNRDVCRLKMFGIHNISFMAR